MDLQHVSPSELQVAEGGGHHKNDGFSLIAPYNVGGGGFPVGDSGANPNPGPDGVEGSGKPRQI
jgi:hypothetical protein